MNKFTFVLVAVLAAGFSFNQAAMAQTKQTISFTSPASASKYTKEYGMLVGDTAGHELRIFEITRTLGQDAPSINGIKMKQMLAHNFTEYVDRNGLGLSYLTILTENGDRIEARGNYVGHLVNEKNSKNMMTLTILSGTGKFLGIQGQIQSETSSHFEAKTVDTNYTITYWMSK
jgi:hypothetical protein